jgi:hypothetical protein
LEVPKIKSVLSELALRVLQFLATFCEKIKIKFLLASKNHLLLLKIRPIALFRKFVPAFRLPSLTLIIVRKPTVILKIVPKAACNKYPITEEKPERNSETAFGTIFRKNKCLQKCMDRNFILILIEEGIFDLTSGLADTNAFGTT